MSLYPMLLAPIYKEKPWGGRRLERLGRALPGGPAVRIGESWELADLAGTSASGGGGGAARSTVRNGPLAKRTLDDVIDVFGDLVTGGFDLARGQGFPLLLKYLDADQNLSVQVHPSAAYAAAHPEAHLKSEAWYVVAAEPDAVIYKGLRPGTTREDFALAIEAGTVPELLRAVPVRPGDCHYLPSGTCHALGGGVMVAEVQTASDTTFRVYDWDREPKRELHIDKALQCIDFTVMFESDFEGPSPASWTDPDGRKTRELVACEHFDLRERAVPTGAVHPFRSERVSILMVTAGRGELGWGDDPGRTLTVGPGDTVLLPAALPVAELRAASPVTLLEVTPPSAAPPSAAAPHSAATPDTAR